MRYKRKGLDFCAHPGCLNQDVAGTIEADGWQLSLCHEHYEDAEDTEKEAQFLLRTCRENAERQGVAMGKYASS